MAKTESKDPVGPTPSERVLKLLTKKDELLKELDAQSRALNLAQMNIDRINGAISLLEEQIKEEKELLPEGSEIRKRETIIPEGKPLHDKPEKE